MKKRQIIGLAVAAVLCAGFVSCGGDDDDEPQNPTENTGSDSANSETNAYGIAVSQEVDLGLSVNWAGWNVGATKPEEYGGYYAWGEIEKKEVYDWDTYKWYNDGNENSIIKYCTDNSFGTVDDRSVLEPEDDVAHVKWGDGWRMPTDEQIMELKSDCIWTWITYNGVNGYKVTGPNGNSIFLPAAGYRVTTSLYWANNSGYYWSSTLNSDYCSVACELGFDDDSRSVTNGAGRVIGQSVRPVREK